MAWKVAPCLVAGNTVVIKPAPMTPHSTSRICELSRDIFPNDVIQVIEGKSDVGGQLVQHPLVKMISFTGSTRVGQSIAIECAKQLKPCTLELGGKNGCVVFDDVDVNQVVDIVLDGAFSNMGQNCCAISRLFLHENIHDFFMQVFIEKASKLVVGHASDPKTDIGPVISREAFDSISSMISKAKKDGLKIALGGSDEESNIIYPTVIQEVPDDHIVAQQEIFGPVLCIMKPFKTVEQVIDRVNDSPYGLACGIFTKNKEILDQMTVKIEAGMIWHNTYNIVPPHLPFGGLKKSGLGKDLGLESVYSFTIQKSIYP
jgi:acyl-CoA reductase-like NAD-dependent aldehyde dehydrogenase